MTNIEDLLSRTRAALGKSSDYALAKALHMTQSQLIEIKKGRQGLGPKAIVRIAEITGLTTHDVLVLANEERAKTPDDKEFWGRRSPRFADGTDVAAMTVHDDYQRPDIFPLRSCATAVANDTDVPATGPSTQPVK
jgi:hypothetical protein